MKSAPHRSYHLNMRLNRMAAMLLSPFVQSCSCIGAGLCMVTHRTRGPGLTLCWTLAYALTARRCIAYPAMEGWTRLQQFGNSLQCRI